jgi:hypothetical protein
MTYHKEGYFVTCSLVLKTEAAWLNSEQSQGSSSFGVQEVQTKRLLHSDFGNLLEITNP